MDIHDRSSSSTLVQIQPASIAYNHKDNSVGITEASEGTDSKEITPAKGKLRASSYVIYVDLPANAHDMLLVHGYTGAYDVVSRRVATYVRSLERYRAPKPLYGAWSPEPSSDGHNEPPSPEIIKSLRRRGYLTVMTPEQEEAFLCKMVDRLHERSLKKSLSYIIMPTYDCNLRCPYCFQDHMRTNSKFHHLLRTISRDGVDRIFSGMTQIEALHGAPADVRPHRTVWFFGGEPLLAASRPIIQYFVERLFQTASASVAAVTNATDLEAYEDLLSPQKISTLQITLDGPQREHDLRRIYADGSGTFAKIAQNIKMALDKGVNVSVRFNIDRKNFHQLPEVAEEMHRLGWDSYPQFSAYAAPIHAGNGNVERSSTMSTWELNQSLEKATREFPLVSLIAPQDDSLKNQVREIFQSEGGGLPQLRESYCGAHTGMYVFDAFGDIYACWERTGDPSIRIGRIKEDGVLELNDAVAKLWRGRTVAANPVCRKCRYALHCGGGCAVLAYGNTGNYHTNFCDGFASRFRACVADAYLQMSSGGVAAPARPSRVCG
jgi:uncharacterized protein